MNRLPLSFAIASVLAAGPALAEDGPYLHPDNSWISLRGIVVEVDEQVFTLDYGRNTVEVGMDNWNWFTATGEAIEGDRVIVYGEIDADTFEQSTIEANSLYVESMGTYFYEASVAGEKGIQAVETMPQTPIDVGDTVVTGTVTSTDASEFTLNSGSKKITVDTSEMIYNPMDDKGYQQIDKGEQVTVTGVMESDLLQTRQLVADSVVTLSDDSVKQ
jgi:hypothetical protein